MVELSVIIPTYNRCKRLQRCLESLCRQTESTDNFEVLVIVDGSTDGTQDFLAALQTPYLLRVLWQDREGQCAARNKGIENASGHLCLFLDDDIVSAPTLVAEHIRAQRVHNGVVGLGRITQTLPAHADWFARCLARGWNERYDRLEKDQETLDTPSPDWQDCYSGNLSVPRAKLQEVGGFALDLPASFDAELGYRLQQQGLSFVYIPGAHGEHDDYKPYRALAFEAERWGKTSVELSRRHPPMLRRLLGTYHEANWLDLTLRYVLLKLDPPLWLLALPRLLFVRRTGVAQWARFLHRYFYWRGVKRAMSDSDAWQRLTLGTPILVYHAFAAQGQPVGRYIVSAHQFEKQMAWLKKAGYHVLSLEEYLLYRTSGRLPPARSVIITIDDGYVDVLTIANPILHRYGYPATVFVVSGCVGDVNQWDAEDGLGGRPLLSWLDIRELVTGGIGIGAHTRTHQSLVKVSNAQIEREVQGSKAELEHNLGIPVRTFAYPFGEHDARVQLGVKEAGFIGSCGYLGGLNTVITPVHNLRRIEITGKDSWVDFSLKVRFGTNRVRPFLKRVKSLFLSSSPRPLSDQDPGSEPARRASA